MMQSYASAAKLRSGGPILHCGLKAMFRSARRHLGSSLGPATASERGPNAVGVISFG